MIKGRGAAVMQYTRGDILCPNRKGHECIVCQPIDCRGILCTEFDEQINKLFPNRSFFFEIKLKEMPKVKDWLGKHGFIVSRQMDLIITSLRCLLKKLARIIQNI